MMMEKYIWGFLLLFVINGCVAKKKFIAEYDARRAAEARETTLRNTYADTQTQLTELTAQAIELSRRIGSLEYLNNQLQTENDALKAQMSNLSSASSSEIEQLRRNIRERSDTLRRREQTLSEVRSIIKTRSDELRALFMRVDTTMQFYRFDGILTEYAQDKAIVIIPTDRLFDATGTRLSKNGEEVIARLAPVLGNNPNIDITVEGHTDNTRPKSSRFADNWELSATQAVIFTKALVKGSQIVAGQAAAAGRGEFLPRASNETRDGQGRNRRIEVVLAPKTSDLIRALERQVGKE